MKRAMFYGVSFALLSTVAGAAEIRASLPASVGPALLGNSASQMPTLSPVPDPVYSQSSGYTPSASYAVPMQPVELYGNVRYRGERNISPCAVPTIIQVPDPCNKDACCKNCVNVQVCAPPCDPQCVKVTRDGYKVRYDYGRYAVVVKSTGNHVVVHYED